MSESRHVLMTTDTVGGVWTYTLELARSLRTFNVDVTLATMGQPLSKDQRRAVRLLPNVDVHESNFRLEWMENPWEDVAAAGEWLLALRHRVKPDLVHSNNYVHGALPWNVPVIVVGHSCMFSWWKAVHKESPPVTWGRYRDEVTLGLSAASAVIAPSAWMLDQLTKLYGPFRNGHVIPNGHRPEGFHVGSKWPLVLCAGRLWDKAKNVSALAEVAGRITWPIYVAGEERFGSSTYTLNRELRYLGQLTADDLARWMAQASIFATPARYEPFGLTVLEAALSGCALVLGDIPSLRENWDGAAVFVEPDDTGALEAAIRRLVQNPDEIRTLSRLAYSRAQSYGAERMGLKYLELYRLVCESLSSTTR
jgi:glycogen synthase